MNHKQKLGYTVLGAVIMLIGIGVGSIVCPPLVAQRNGVFDEIVCSKLTVVDEMGKVAIRSAALKTGHSILIFDDKGGLKKVPRKPGVECSTRYGCG